MKKHQEIIFRKQCEIVEVDFESIDFTVPMWMDSHMWTHDNERDFRDWLAEYLFTNKDARIEIGDGSWSNKKKCVVAAKEWTDAFGWKYKF